MITIDWGNPDTNFFQPRNAKLEINLSVTVKPQRTHWPSMKDHISSKTSNPGGLVVKSSKSSTQTRIWGFCFFFQRVLWLWWFYTWNTPQTSKYLPGELKTPAGENTDFSIFFLWYLIILFASLSIPTAISEFRTRTKRNKSVTARQSRQAESYKNGLPTGNGCFKGLWCMINLKESCSNC